MQINISGRHVEVTPPLKEYATNKVSRLEHHFHHISQIHVILSVENKLDQKAEAIVNLAGQQIFAEAVTHDMYAAIDEMIDKLDRQIIKHKEKLKDHHHDSHNHHNNGHQE